MKAKADQIALPLDWPQTDGEARFLLIGPEVTSTEAGGKPAWSYESGAANRA